ncbi:MAG TPA: matrixin family metalloprotease [Polyangiaceae bacterium]|nr:matrixin family metalloprotease [Polyangiaceae bacterium]
MTRPGRPTRGSRARRAPQRTPRVLAVAVELALAAWLCPHAAAAFCQNTTCKDTEKKTCLKDDQGCTTEGAPLHWNTSCITFHMNRLGTASLDVRQTRTAIMKSFRSWSEVDCGGGKLSKMAFVALEDVDCKRAEYNKTGKNVNVVLFQDNDWKYRGIDGTLAKTSATFDTDTGEIFDADIEVNTAFNQVTVSDEPGKIAYDLQAILTHEVGHFLGIGHSANERATMFPAYAPGTVAIRELSDDDKKAVCAAYPPTSTLACNQEPRGGYSPTCDDPAAAGGGGEAPSGCAASGGAPLAGAVAPGVDGAPSLSAAATGLAGAGTLLLLAIGRRLRRRPHRSSPDES